MVRVHVLNDQGGGIFSSAKHLSLMKCAIAVAEEDGHISVVASVGISGAKDSQIELVIRIKIACSHTSAVLTCAKVHGGIERAIPFTQ